MRFSLIWLQSLRLLRGTVRAGSAAAILIFSSLAFAVVCKNCHYQICNQVSRMQLQQPAKKAEATATATVSVVKGAAHLDHELDGEPPTRQQQHSCTNQSSRTENSKSLACVHEFARCQCHCGRWLLVLLLLLPLLLLLLPLPLLLLLLLLVSLLLLVVTVVVVVAVVVVVVVVAGGGCRDCAARLWWLRW